METCTQKITDTKKFAQGVIFIRPLKNHGDDAKSRPHLTTVVRISEDVDCIISQSSPLAGFCEHGDENSGSLTDDVLTRITTYKSFNESRSAKVT